MKKTIAAVTLLLVSVTVYAAVIGDYNEIEDVTGWHYEVHRSTLNQPITPPDPMYPWLEPNYEFSVWDSEKAYYGFPGGSKTPGATIDLLYGIEETGDRQNLTVICRLYKLEDTPILLKEDKQNLMGPPYRCRLIVKLPDSYPARYSLGVVAYDTEGRILDAMTSRINVPEQELVGALRVEPNVITDETKATLLIFNNGATRLEYGTIYRYQKYVNTSWIEVPSEGIWILPMYSTGPGKNASMTINVKGLDSGLYRVIKKFAAAGTDLEENISAEFSVMRPVEPIDQIPVYGYKYTMGLSHSSVESPDRSMLELYNLGARSLYFDGTYLLETKENGEWVRFYENTTTNLTVVKRGEPYKLKLGTPDMPLGDYRLTVVFGIEGTSAKDTIQVEFDR